MVKTKQILMFFGIVGACNVSAMARMTRQLPSLQRAAALVGRTYNQVIKQEIFKENTHEKNNVVSSALRRVAIGAGLAATIQADNIVDTVHGMVNMALFDERLIPEEFLQAMVRIYNTIDFNPKRGSFIIRGQGSAFITRGEHEPHDYFVVTAAHCLIKGNEYVIILRDRGFVLGEESFKVVPLIYDQAHDIAVLVVSVEDLEKIRTQTGKDIPFISARNFSTTKPYKKQAAVLYGYPDFISPKQPAFYAQKFVSKGAQTWTNIPGEVFSSSQYPPLFGASGGPIITVRNSQAEVLGLLALGRPRQKQILIAGAGNLADYVNNAEEVAEQKRVAQKIKDKLEEASAELGYATVA